MPANNQLLNGTSLSVFEPIIARLKTSRAKKIIPLHQGKTAYTTPVELRPWDSSEFEYPPYHDGPTSGTAMLVNAISEKLGSQAGGQAVDTSRIQVTCGITHALAIVFHCILKPQEEIIILSPHWLFVNGLVRAAGGNPVEVPFFPAARGGMLPAVAERIAPYVTEKTRAIYFNSPNCPTGYALSPAQIRELVEFARRHDLWVISDNAYEYFDYSEGFVDPALQADGASRTFSTYSFSKSFGLTGYRIGYLLSPPDMAVLARKFGLYSIYSVPTCCQFVALSAMRADPAVIAGHQSFVKEALDIATSELRVPATRPDGGFYTFLDLSDWTAGSDDFIDRCIDAGVSLAPGTAFGRDYADFVRLCYAVVDQDDLSEGIAIINRIYQQGS